MAASCARRPVAGKDRNGTTPVADIRVTVKGPPKVAAAAPHAACFMRPIEVTQGQTGTADMAKSLAGPCARG